MSLHLEILTLQDLPTFVASDRFQQLPDIPISPQRARSYAHHPHAKKSLQVLYLAWEKEQLVGYRLILPDTAYLPDGPRSVGWYSCVWVHPSHRGKGIARQLVAQTMSDWKGEILYQNPAPASHGLYQSTGRFAPYTLSGQRWYHRFHFAELWSRKKGNSHPLTPFLMACDYVANTLLYPLLQFRLPKTYDTTAIAEVDQWSASALALMKESCKKQLFHRDAETWQWISDYPWVEEGPENEVTKRYYFSATARQYQQQRIEIRREGTTVGAFFTRLWNGHLDVLYWWGDSAAAKLAVAYLGYQVSTAKVLSITVFHPLLKNEMQQRHTGFAFSKSVERHYYYPKDWSIGDRQIQPGDGDGVFT